MRRDAALLERPLGAAELRLRAERAFVEWARAWADYQASLVELDDYEERSREWVRTGIANGVPWPPSADARARWGT